MPSPDIRSSEQREFIPSSDFFRDAAPPPSPKDVISFDAQQEEDAAAIHHIEAWLEREQEEDGRQEFAGGVAAAFGNLTEDYVKHVRCHDSEEAYSTYQQEVRAHAEKPWYKKMVSKNPEVGVPPRGYHIARSIELYVDTMRKNSKEPVRILYPAAGGDVGGLLASIDLLKEKNIELVFVDPGMSQTGTPESAIIPQLRERAPGIAVLNHKQTLAEYIATNPKPVDVFLYDTPSLNNPLAIGPGIFQDVDMEAFGNGLSKDALMIGDNRGVEEMLSAQEQVFFQKNFSPVDTPNQFPLSIRGIQSKEGMVPRVAA